MERLLLLLLCHGYHEENENNEIRVYLKLPFQITPIQIAVFPLSKQEIPLAEAVYKKLQKKYRVIYDDNGSIGKRYRRQDEIGTTYCITVDQKSIIDNTVTIRDRDTKEQVTVLIDELENYFIS